MKTVKNKKTGVVKKLKTEIEVSMYLSTKEWELVEEKKDSKSSFSKQNSSNNQEENRN